MNTYTVNGGKKLSGEVTLHGAKNSALPILAACVLIKGKTVIHNCPRISDVDATADILKSLGCKVSREGTTLTVDAESLNSSSVSEEDMRRMRSSITFLGALISRCGRASIFYPGGCEIGLRPIDIHLKAFRAMGVNVEENGSSISCTADRIIPTKIILPFPSVGATENIIIASTVSKGTTVIINPAREPEVADLADFLNKCGARIRGAGESIIEIEGVSSLKPCEHTIIPDRILASTYMSAAAVTGSEILIKDVRYTHTAPVFPAFSEMGCRIYIKDKTLRIKAPKRLRRVRMIKTMPFPGFPTDSQSMVISALSLARGTSVFQENIFENRFRFISELKRFGADIDCNCKLALINGVRALTPARVNATDLRGGAALVVAALAADGESVINNINYIERGYDGLDISLNSLGADIKRN